MSDTISSTEVKAKAQYFAEFYLLKTGDQLSTPYPLNSLDAVFFVDTLKAAGWTSEHFGEKTVILSSPPESNIVLFMSRAGVAS